MPKTKRISFEMDKKLKDVFVFVASCLLLFTAFTLSRANNKIENLRQELEKAKEIKPSECECPVCSVCEPCPDALGAWKEMAESCIDSKIRTKN